MAKRASMVVLLAALWSFCAWAQPASEKTPVGRGKSLALELCSICHVVAQNQRDAPLIKRPTPSFHDVANSPKTTAKSLRRFLATTHWDENTVPMTMPNFNLSPRQTNDVIAYILSLRRQARPERAPSGVSASAARRP